MSGSVPDVNLRTSSRMSRRTGSNVPTLFIMSPKATGSSTYRIWSPFLRTRASLTWPVLLSFIFGLPWSISR